MRRQDTQFPSADSCTGTARRVARYRAIPRSNTPSSLRGLSRHERPLTFCATRASRWPSPESAIGAGLANASWSLDFVHDQGMPIAVGTRIATRPPHRTVRAAFPHTAPTLDDDADLLAYARHRVTLFPVLSLARVTSTRILLGPSPWLHRLRDGSLHSVRRFHRYYGWI